MRGFLAQAVVFTATIVSLLAGQTAHAQANSYTVMNQWGGSTAPWNAGGTWVLGGRANQGVVAIQIKSPDAGKTLTGTMTYANEGPIGFRASAKGNNQYAVENQWGGSTAPWQPGGTWVIGGRTGQAIVALDVMSADQGKTLNGTATYNGEGPIGFKGTLSGSAPAPAPAPAPPAPVATSYFILTAKHSGKVIGVASQSKANGAPVIQWTASNTDNEKWVPENGGDGYLVLRALHSGQVLNVSGGSKAPGAKVIQWPKTGGDNEKWKIDSTPDGFVTLTAKHSGLLLNVSGGNKADGGELVQWPKTGGDNEKFKLVKMPLK
jgi:hypothetical protein